MSQAKETEVLVEAVIIDGSVSWNGLPNNGTPILLDAELAKAYVNAGIAKYVADAKIKPTVGSLTWERDDKEND